MKKMFYLRKFRKEDNFYFMSLAKKARKDGGYPMICGACYGSFTTNPFQNKHYRCVKIPTPIPENAVISKSKPYEHYLVLSHYDRDECEKNYAKRD